MLTIQGVVQIYPLSINIEDGTLSMGDKEQPAVVQTLLTESGPVQVVFPVEHIDAIVDALGKAKEKAEKPKSDLYIPSSEEEVKQIADLTEKVTEGKN